MVHLDSLQQQEFQQMVPPYFTRPLEPVKVAEGNEAQFTVAFKGDPSPAVKWFRYNYQIKGGSEDFQITAGSDTSTLTVRRACKDDSGIFTCLLENIVGSSRASTNLEVVGPPAQSPEEPPEVEYTMSAKTSRTLQEMVVEESDNIRIDIQFTSGTRSDLQFFHEGRPIQESSGQGVQIFVENDVATLLISDARPEHSGHYECKMVTPAGEATCKVKCIVKPKKQQPLK